MKYRISDFVLKVWLSSIMAAPLLLFIEGLVTSPSSQVGIPDFDIFLVVILMAAMFSLPSLALFYLTGRFVIPKIKSIMLIKTVLSIAGILLTYIPFLVIDNFHPLLNVDLLSRPLFITYSSTIILGVWLYKIKPVSLASIEEPETFHI